MVDDKTKKAATVLVEQMLADGCRIRTPLGALIVIVKGEHVDALDDWYDEHMAPLDVV